MKSFHIIACMFFAFLVGCAGKTGHTFLEEMSEAEVASKLIKNKTTQEQVRKTFGDPEDIDLREDGKESWVYKFVRSEAKGINFIPIASSFYRGTNDSIKKLKILFNVDGTVEKFSFSCSQGETQLGLFQ